MSWIVKTKVLVPIDFSEYSLRAMETARELVEDPKQLHVLHVLLPMSVMEPGAVWNELDDEKRAENIRKHLRKELGEETYNAVNVDVLIGYAPKVIVRHAKELKAGLILMHARGADGGHHFFMGSVTERVVRHSECSVLVLRD